MSDKPWTDPDVLRELRFGKGMDVTEVADELGVSRQTIHKYLKKHDVEPPWRDEDILADMIGYGMTYEEIGDALNCSEWTILRQAKEFDLNRGRGSHSYKKRTGRAHFAHADDNGHERLTCTTNRDMVKVHRLVAVAECGFDAVCGNVVHHRNHVPWDNRPSNLRVMSDSEHRSYHNRKRYE